MKTQSRISRLRAPLISGLSALALVALAGCGPVRLIANTNIPSPLVVKIPIAVALFIPKEFSTYVHNEERWSTMWHADLGKAQSDGITRLMNALFERVVPVDSVSAGAQVPGGVTAILEPSIEEYAFVTPRDAGSPFYAVSIKYRASVDIREAVATHALESREQAGMRGLSPESAAPGSPVGAGTPPAPGAAPATTATPGTPAQQAEPKDEAPPSEAGQPPVTTPSEPA